MAIATPNVRLIAHTTIPWEFVEDERHDDGSVTVQSVHATDFLMERGEGATDMDNLAEFAGRACYRAESKPNPATEQNADYLANIIRQQHTSVLEHSSASFYITGVSRAFLAEITRHRHLSFSVQSQRFVDESEANIVVPPAIRELGMGSYLDDVMVGASRDYTRLVRDLTDAGLPRKQAREAARAVLPNMTEVRMVVSGNMRAWRDTLVRRIAPGADAEMREVAGMILAELKKLAPASFQDFE